MIKGHNITNRIWESPDDNKLPGAHAIIVTVDSSEVKRLDYLQQHINTNGTKLRMKSIN